ncbi:MAG: DUF1109 domain-containing protein [Steroidobacteraceae bacterium]
MQTIELIEQLAADLRPTARHAIVQRLAVSLAAGALIALVLVLVSLGPRNDLAAAVLSSPFWMKWGYTLAVTAAALALCARLARPEGAPGILPLVLAVPFLLICIGALIQLGAAPPAQRVPLWLGNSAVKCPWIIAALSVPIFLGVLWTLRQFAPTNLRLTGFAAGCLAGAVAAVVYAVHCNESAIPFVATWYSAGILIPALLGLVVGPRALRW